MNLFKCTTYVIFFQVIMASYGVLAHAQPPGHLAPGDQLWPQIETSQQALLYANAQVLVSRWNNMEGWKIGNEEHRKAL